jgi:hypothetical protein
MDLSDVWARALRSRRPGKPVYVPRPPAAPRGKGTPRVGELCRADPGRQARIDLYRLRASARLDIWSGRPVAVPAAAARASRYAGVRRFRRSWAALVYFRGTRRAYDGFATAAAAAAFHDAARVLLGREPVNFPGGAP